MSSKSAIFSIIVSILCSVLITAGLLYFIGPIIVPELDKVSILEENDLVLQYKYQEWDSDAWVTDYNVAYQKINDTELSITIQENSQLFITFSSMAYLWLSYDFANYSAYSISLVVEGVGNRSFSIIHYDPRPTVGLIYQKLTYNLNIDYFTGPLSAGTYNITMFWKSLYDSTEYTYLSVADSGYDNIRSLWVMELKSL